MLKKKIKVVIAFIILFLSVAIFLAGLHIYNNYDEDIIYQIIYYLNNGFKKGTMSLVHIGIKENIIPLIVLFWLITLPITFSGENVTFIKYRIFGFKKEIQVFPNKTIKQKPIIYAITIMIICLLSSCYFLGFFRYITKSNQTTNIFEKYYVDPKQKKIIFPENKNNLILIFLESMENSYLSEKNGGMFNPSIIPELEEIASNNISFSHNQFKVGGSRNTIGSAWTVASLVSHTAGIPLKVYGDIGGNDMGQNRYFLPGAYSLGEVLAKEGYNQQLMLGSDSNFGSRRKYFLQHGNYKIYDLGTAQDSGDIPNDYLEFWGFEDAKLFELAKKEIIKLSVEEKPFNFTMLTVDSHNPGYDDKSCEIELVDSILKAISCTSLRVGQFLTWLSKQPYYSETTIIIVGDHLGMNISALSEDEEYERTIYNAIINSRAVPIRATNRIFTAYDFYPTILAAMGAKIYGEQLGLGVNLFSAKETISERLGFTNFDDELEKRSDYYFNQIYLNK